MSTQKTNTRCLSNSNYKNLKILRKYCIIENSIKFKYFLRNHRHFGFNTLTRFRTWNWNQMIRNIGTLQQTKQIPRKGNSINFKNRKGDTLPVHWHQIRSLPLIQPYDKNHNHWLSNPCNSLLSNLILKTPGIGALWCSNGHSIVDIVNSQTWTRDIWMGLYLNDGIWAW